MALTNLSSSTQLNNNHTITVTGLTMLSGGSLVLAGSNATTGTGTATFNANGGLDIGSSFSTLNLSANSAPGILNVLGNLNLTAGNIRKTGGGTGTLNLVKASGGQTVNIHSTGISLDNVTVNIGNGSTSNTVSLNANLSLNAAASLTVFNLARLNSSTFITTGGSFSLAGGATHGIGSSLGITSSGSNGNIQTTTRTFPSNAHYVFNGSGDQVTGSGLPATITGSLQIANTGVGNNTVTLSNTGTTTGTLTLTSGRFAIGSGQQINISAGGIVNGNGGDFATGATGGTVFFGSTGSFSGSSNPYNVRIQGAVNFGTGIVTIQNGGNLRIDQNGGVTTNAPYYATGATLQYSTNGTYQRFIEWNAGSGRGNPHHVWLSNGTILTPARDDGSYNATSFICNGNLSIDNGAALYMDYTGDNMNVPLQVGGDILINGSLSGSQTSGGDIKLGGNWTRSATGNFYPNNRAVFFTGSGNTQTITTAGGGTETFAYMVLDKPAGNVQLTATPATDVTVDGSLGGDVLQLLRGNLDLNGRLFQLGGVGGNLKVDGTERQIFSTTSAVFRVIGYKEIKSSNSGTLLFNDQTTVEIAAGLNFGSNITTINSTLQINAGGYADINAPIYGPQGKLTYNTGGTYLRRVEWSGNVEGGPGFPNDVELKNSTTLWASGSIGEKKNTLLSAERDLLIGSGSALRMDGTYNMEVPLVVGRNLTIHGNLTTSTISGVDVFVGQNWYRGGSGSFTHNNRAVFFNTAQAGIISVASGSESFPYVIIDKNGSTANTLTLASPVDITNKLTLSSGRVITDGTNVLSITNKEPDDGTNGISYPDDGKSYVDGPIRRQVRALVSGDGTNNYLFPVGNLSGATHLFRRFRLKQVSGPDNYFTGQFLGANPPGLDGNGKYDFFGDDLQGIMKSEYWQVDRGLAASTKAVIVVPYVNPGNGGWFDVNGVAVSPPTDKKVHVAMVHSPAFGNWEYAGNGAGFDADPNQVEPEARPYTNNGELKSRELESFSPFGIGYGYASILPISLLSFKATLHGPDALLHWTIGDAKDLKQFEVEHSNDGQIFTRLATIVNNEGTDYNYRHMNLQSGVHYYRLKMVEKDGRNRYSNVEVLMLNTSKTLITGLLQNPIQGGLAVVKMYSAANQQAEAMVIDMAGRTLLRQKIGLQTGYNQPSLSLLLLPAGMYKLLIRTQDGVEKVLTIVK